MKTSSLKFPVIGFSEGTMTSFQTVEQLTTCTRKGRRWYDNLTLVDSEGRSCEVRGAEPGREGSCMIRCFQTLIGKMRVEPVFASESCQLDLGNLRQRVNAVLSRDPDFWSAAGNVEAIRSQIEQVNSFEEIICLFI